MEGLEDWLPWIEQEILRDGSWRKLMGKTEDGEEFAVAVEEESGQLGKGLRNIGRCGGAERR